MGWIKILTTTPLFLMKIISSFKAAIKSTRDIFTGVDLAYVRFYYVISISVINNCTTPINYKMMTSDLKQGKYYAKKSISFISCFIY